MFVLLACCLLATTQAIKVPPESCNNEQGYYTVTQVVDHSCPCNDKSAGTLRYRNNKIQYCNGVSYVELGGGKAPELGSEGAPAESCSEILKERPDAENGVYYLKENDKAYKVYCHMDSICGSKGWTLLLKMDGSKQTFKYDSTHWTSDNDYDADAVSQGLKTNSEMKLHTYSTFPFSKLCLGMRVGASTRWVPVSHKASSLYSVIAGNKYLATKLGRNAWKSLISGSSLQTHCNREGFNVNLAIKARIGIVNNQENNCRSPDSYVGFGVKPHSACGLKNTITVGNGAGCSPDNGNRNTAAMGFVLAQ